MNKVITGFIIGWAAGMLVAEGITEGSTYKVLVGVATLVSILLRD